MANETVFRIEPDAADLAEIRGALSKISWESIDLEPALSAAGEKILDIFRESFEREKAPDDTPWPELAPATQAARVYGRRDRDASRDARRRRRPGRVRGGEHILQAMQVPGWLLRDLGMEVGAYSLAVGEMGKVGHAAYRSEFGSLEEDQPPRPFVEATEEVQNILGDELVKWLAGRWS